MTKRVDQRAALVGLIAGLIALVDARFAAPVFGVVIAWPWLALIGAVTTSSVGYLASFALPGCRRPASTNPSGCRRP